MFEAFNDPTRMERILASAKAPMLYFNEKFEEAESSAAEGIALAERMESCPEIARALSCAAWVALKLGKYGEAKKQLEGAMQHFGDSGNGFGYLAVKWNLAQMKFTCGKFEEALSISHEGLRNSNEEGALMHKCNFHSLIMKSAEALGRADIAAEEFMFEGESYWKRYGKLKVRDFLESNVPPRSAAAEDYFPLLEGYKHRPKLLPLYRELSTLNPDAIILRGSLATIDYSAGSDADFTVLAPRPGDKSEQALKEAERQYPFSMAVLVDTEEFLGMGGHEKLLIVYQKSI